VGRSIANVGKITSNELITAKEINKLSWQQFEALTVEIIARENSSTSAWLTSIGGWSDR
jgi:hypothetical protein